MVFGGGGGFGGGFLYKSPSSPPALQQGKAKRKNISDSGIYLSLKNFWMKNEHNERHLPFHALKTAHAQRDVSQYLKKQNNHLTKHETITC